VIQIGTHEIWGVASYMKQLVGGGKKRKKDVRHPQVRMDA